MCQAFCSPTATRPGSHTVARHGHGGTARQKVPRNGLIGKTCQCWLYKCAAIPKRLGQKNHDSCGQNSLSFRHRPAENARLFAIGPVGCLFVHGGWWAHVLRCHLLADIDGPPAFDLHLGIARSNVRSLSLDAGHSSPLQTFDFTCWPCFPWDRDGSCIGLLSPSLPSIEAFALPLVALSSAIMPFARGPWWPAFDCIWNSCIMLHISS